MKKEELLRDAGIIGVLWASVLLVILDLPGVAVTTKYLLVILASMVTIVVSVLYFGWDEIYARRSFAVALLLAIYVVGILVYMGFTLDWLVFTTWQWYSVNGIIVVTWFNMLELSLLFLSVAMYYWMGVTLRSLLKRLKQPIRRRPRRTQH